MDGIGSPICTLAGRWPATDCHALNAAARAPLSARAKVAAEKICVLCAGSATSSSRHVSQSLSVSASAALAVCVCV